MVTPRATTSRPDALLMHAREPMFVLNAESRLVYVNRAWEELTGHTAEQAARVTCRPHGPNRPGDLEGLGGSFCPPPEALAGRPASVVTLVIHAGGERKWRRLEFWPLIDSRSDQALLLGQVRDLDAPLQAPDSDALRLRVELLQVRDRLLARYGSDALIGVGPAHRRVLDQVAAAAAATAPVLIVGEPGTGKRSVARAIHAAGPRRQSPFLHFDCGALPPEVLGRELFGRELSGLDDDLHVDRPARLALPEGSTFAIIDLLDLARDLQSSLAAALGGPARLIGLTAGDPDAARRAGRLRDDMYYAATTLVIRLAPLRDRPESIPLLAQHFLERANLCGGRQRSGFSAESVEALVAYDWPGNLRELARVVDASHGRGDVDGIRAADIPASIRGHLGAAYTPPPAAPRDEPLDELLTRVERRLIEQALKRARHNKSRAADFLAISRPRLYRRIKELGIPEEPEPAEEAGAS